MKSLISILLIFSSFCLAQDRSLIFSTGSPDSTLGHAINWDGSSGQSVSDKFFVSGNMVLEAIKVYAVATSETAIAKIVLNTDDNGVPGNELHSWEIDVISAAHGNNYFIIITTDLCIYLDENNYYWLTLHSANNESELNWLYSNNSTFTYSTSNDQGISWDNPSIGQCGALSIYAEYIYESDISETGNGDLNFDESINVLDVVILANSILTNNTIPEGDINGDGTNNVLDIVGLVQIVLNGEPAIQLSTWEYIDINSNSNYFNQLIGPDQFLGNVTLFYFGKAG